MRYLSAGESHGPGLTAIIEGLPSNLEVKVENINFQLARRQKGYGRGGRMKIEKDKVRILSGLRFGKTLGSPLTLFIENRDYDNWKEYMDPEPPEREGKRVSSPRPGHADLPGILKYRHKDIRNVLERASARETAMRVAVGSIARELLSLFGIQVYSHVVEIGRVKSERVDLSLEEFFKKVEESSVRCAHEESEKEMIAEIDRVREEGDSLGGIFEILVTGVPPGLGSHVHWDRKLEGRLAGALMSLQAIKGVEVGLGIEGARLRGSQVQDEIFFDVGKGYYHETNRAGGIEGGMSNGEPLLVRCAMKPIPTLYKPLRSVDIDTKKSLEAGIERSDVCAVPAAGVAGEAVAAWEVARAFLEKFSGDSMEEIRDNYKRYLDFLAP